MFNVYDHYIRIFENAVLNLQLMLSFEFRTGFQSPKWNVHRMANSAIRERESWVSDISSDNGGRRKKTDRRQFFYTFHIPERRSGIDRRVEQDRRTSVRCLDE